MKNEHPAFFPPNGTMINSLNYEGHCSNWVAVLPLSWRWQTACWLCHRLNGFEWLAVMVISQPLRNNPSYYYRAASATSIALNASQRHLMFYTCNYNIRVTHRNGAIKHIFYTKNQIHGGSSDCSLFILSLHALALHLAVKILLQIFLYEDLSTLALTYICRLYSSECQPALLHLTILLSENIPNIWHKSSTKHKEVRPDWND